MSANARKVRYSLPGKTRLQSASNISSKKKDRTKITLVQFMVAWCTQFIKFFNLHTFFYEEWLIGGENAAVQSEWRKKR